MATISNVGNPVVVPPTDVNRPNRGESARSADTQSIDPAASPKFVDRRKNPDRRQASKKPLLDTRHRKDRRRTGRFETKI